MRSLPWLVVCGVALGACGDKKAADPAGTTPPVTETTPVAAQTTKEALAILCDAVARSDAKSMNPSERNMRLSKWISEHVTNPEVREVFAALGNVSPQERSATLGAFLAKHNVTSCALLEEWSLDRNVPEVTVGALAARPTGAALLITPFAIVVEGQAIVAVRSNAVDPVELEGGAKGMIITKLGRFLEALKLAPDAPLQVIVDRGTTYRVLSSVIATAGRAKIAQLALIARKKGVVGAIPLTLPKPANVAHLNGSPVMPVVTVTKDKLLLWSMSGREGTLKAPKLTLTLSPSLDLAALSTALVEIAGRGPKDRTSEDRAALAMFDPETPMPTVLGVLAALRGTDGGVELYPDVNLGAGFE